eukprot:m.149296 g.149296  ORF g.149296 m.149296 type:complete len:448 (-) comp15010_c0_seq1:49-1392(-)
MPETVHSDEVKDGMLSAVLTPEDLPTPQPKTLTRKESDANLTSAWNNLRPIQIMHAEFDKMCERLSTEICAAWWNSKGQGKAALTPRLPDSSTKYPSYLNVLLSIHREISKKVKGGDAWCISEFEKILKQQEASQIEIETFFRLISFDNSDSHFITTLIRRTPQLHPHWIFLIRELCKDTSSKAIDLLNTAVANLKRPPEQSQKPTESPRLLSDVPSTQSDGSTRSSLSARRGMSLKLPGTPNLEPGSTVTRSISGNTLTEPMPSDVLVLFQKLTSTTELLTKLINKEGTPNQVLHIPTSEKYVNDPELKSFFIEHHISLDYLKKFQQNEIDFYTLINFITKDDLRELGLPVGTRARLMHGIQKYQEETEAEKRNFERRGGRKRVSFSISREGDGGGDSKVAPESLVLNLGNDHIGESSSDDALRRASEDFTEGRRSSVDVNSTFFA